MDTTKSTWPGSAEYLATQNTYILAQSGRRFVDVVSKVPPVMFVDASRIMTVPRLYRYIYLYIYTVMKIKLIREMGCCICQHLTVTTKFSATISRSQRNAAFACCNKVGGWTFIPNATKSCCGYAFPRRAPFQHTHSHRHRPCPRRSGPVTNPVQTFAFLTQTVRPV